MVEVKDSIVALLIRSGQVIWSEVIAWYCSIVKYCHLSIVSIASASGAAGCQRNAKKVFNTAEEVATA